MTPFYLLAGLLLALIVTVIVASVRGSAPEPRPGSLDPAARQQALLAQLAELEFEYQTGKIGEDDYQELKSRLAREALTTRSELGVPDAPGEGGRPDEAGSGR